MRKLLIGAGFVGAVGSFAACLIDTSGLAGGPTSDSGAPSESAPDTSTAPADSGGTNADAAIADAGPAENYRRLILADHPDGYWRLDEGANATVAKDEVGGHDGTYVQVTTAAGPFTGRLSAVFDGSKSLVSLPNGFDYSGTAPYTVEAWAQPEFTAGTGCHHIWGRETRSSPRQGYGLLSFQDAGILMERIVADGNQNTIFGDEHLLLASNTFSHVVGTYDGSIPKLYVNGVLVQTGIPDQRALGPLTITPVIGAGAQNDCVWNGRIAEVAVYSTALSATQVAAHYAARF